MTYVVDGPANAILCACRSSPTRSSLLRETSISESDLEGGLRLLAERKLVLELGGRFVALPLLTPVVETPAPSDLPGGEVDDPGLFGFNATRGLARRVADARRKAMLELFREIFPK